MGQQQSSAFTLLMPSCIPARPPRRVSACDSSTSTAPSRALLPAASLQPPQQTRGFIHRPPHRRSSAHTKHSRKRWKQKLCVQIQPCPGRGCCAAVREGSSAPGRASAQRAATSSAGQVEAPPAPEGGLLLRWAPSGPFPPPLLSHCLKKGSELRKPAAPGLTDSARQLGAKQRALTATRGGSGSAAPHKGRADGRSRRTKRGPRAERSGAAPRAEERGEARARRSGPPRRTEPRTPRLAAPQARTARLTAQAASPAPPALTCCPRPPAELRRSPGPAPTEAGRRAGHAGSCSPPGAQATPPPAGGVRPRPFRVMQGTFRLGHTPP